MTALTHNVIIPISLILTCLLLVPSALAQDAWEADEPELFLDGLDHPVDLAFGRDGYLYFALLRDLKVHRVSIETEELDEGFTVEFPDAHWESGTETGLLGITLADDFHQTGILYASYTSHEDGNWTNVLSRITLQDETGAADEQALMTRPGLEFHNGGRVMIADGHLWWTTGDAQHYMDPLEGAYVVQEDGNLLGKVLRLTMEGDPAPGNPWDDHAYTKGHRNVFGIAWDPQNERAFITENAAQEGDYVQILEAGANYGWPDCEGFCEEPQQEYTDPVWQEEDRTIAPTGATWFRGAFWWGTYNQGELHQTHDTDDEWNTSVFYAYPGDEENRPAILDVQAGPDDASIWFATLTTIMRLSFEPHPDWPAQEPQEEGPYWWELEEEDREVEPEPEDTPGPPVALVLVTLAVFAGSVLARNRCSS